MTSEETSNLATVRAYLAALEAGAVGDDLARFFTSDALQVELPNKLNPDGARSDVATLLERAARGQKLLQRQTYAIRSELAHGSRVAVEASWSAVLAVPVGTLAAGAGMKAHFAMFFDLTGGRISSQRNYDCFEPW
jgi:ketosteroid isomerase-like protein